MNFSLGGLVGRLRAALAPARSPSLSPRAQFTRSQVARITREIRAKYDAAQTTDENRKHWAWADDLSANAANSAEVRRVLRRRCRYERDNNSYCNGIAATLAGDLIGTGPRLQLMTANEKANRFIERELGFWSDAVDLPGKFFCLEGTRHVDGEGFGLLTTNRALRTPVRLDVQLIEADQVTTTDFTGNDPYAVDGIRLDANFNPIEYHVLPFHPGYQSLGQYSTFTTKYRRVAAKNVVHWFTPTRPGQARGIPTFTPALALFAQLRRYILAVLAAAEIAAELAAFIQSDLPAGGDDGDSGAEAFELLEMVRGQIMTLPQGWQISQINPTQPTTGFSEFCNQILREIARCLQMPWGLAAGDSSSYNYASGRLDVQTYQRMIKVVRARFERMIMDKVFEAWLDEAILIPGYLPLAGLPPYQEWSWRWHWDQFEHVDPTKEANAIETLLRNNAITMEQIYAAKGQDWAEAFEQLAKERKEMERLGLTPAGTAPAPPIPAAPATPPESANATVA